MWTITANFKRFMRRLFLWLAVIFVVLAIVHVAVDVALTLQIRSVEHALYAKGIPKTIESDMPRLVPVNENAAPFYERAFDLMMDGEKGLKYKSPDWDGNILFIKTIESIDKIAYKDYRRLTNSEKQEIIKLFRMPELQIIYHLLEQASRKPKCYFPESFKRSYEIIEPAYVTTRIMSHVIKHLSLRAHLEAEIGNINKAMETLLVSFKILHHFDNIPDGLSQMVRTLNADVLIEKMQEILATENVSVPKLRALFAEVSSFSDMTPVINSHKAMIARDISSAHEQLKDYSYDRFEYNVHMVILPKFYKRYLSKLYEKNDCLTWMKRALKVYGIHIIPYYKIPQEFKVSSNNESRDSHFEMEKLAISFYARHRATVDVAKVGLALKLYKIQHGAFPDSLNKLQPDFLKEVPLDPFTGQELIYRKQKDGFILYSVGHNLKDDGGIPYTPYVAIEKNTKGDIVWKSEN